MSPSPVNPAIQEIFSQTASGTRKLRAVLCAAPNRSTTVKVRPAIRALSAGLTLGLNTSPFVAAGANRILDAPPPSWPTALKWKPRRFFGPFWAGSDLAQIQLSIGSVVQWYFNSFFTGHPDATVYDSAGPPVD